MFRFPVKDSDRCEKWIRATGNPALSVRLNWDVSESTSKKNSLPKQFLKVGLVSATYSREVERNLPNTPPLLTPPATSSSSHFNFCIPDTPDKVETLRKIKLKKRLFLC
ncbi:hypothetical protein ILUMI_18914 [Ignelater luminosus]|uniref:Uncharacterized protein n=1 Tax=Ignelater luminosus TaxID=2038154 RepID=A0A8K0CH42_IGNLU|nr:hypothetical protein ILUMI_18914 [Ignelater luminosus]